MIIILLFFDDDGVCASVSMQVDADRKHDAQKRIQHVNATQTNRIKFA